jgi:Uma2 family endonuclease
MTVMPRDSYDWTVDDLDQLPDDGLQYELLDGMLLVTPAPIPDHQRFARGIFLVLHEACPYERFEVFFAPIDWQPDLRTSLQPDVLVVAKDRIGAKNITEPLALAVEVLSPSTRRKDMVLKRSKYQDAGVACYWIVDPTGPAVTAYELRDGGYLEAGSAEGAGTLRLETPFPVTITPAALAG